MNKISYLVVSIILLGLAATARAQESFPAGPVDRFFPLLGHVLTQAQRQSLRQIVGSQSERIRPLEAKMFASREALLKQVMLGKFDDNAANQYATESAKAEADLTVLFAKALSEMQPRLTAGQIAELKNASAARFRDGRNAAFHDETAAAPEVHLKLPPSLPRDTNDLPVVN